MKAIDIINGLFATAMERDYSRSCDTCKAGDPEAEVTKVAVAMFPTPDLIRQVKEWGAQLLIVHEPAYYNHMDVHSEEKQECEKRKRIEESGITVYRYHDHAHWSTPDVICAGEVKYMGLSGTAAYSGFDLVRITLDQPMTPVEIAATLEKNLGIKHIRICGSRDAACTKVSGMFGAPGGVFEELKSDNTEVVLVGETSEWSLGEYARDAAQLGYKKALLILGHEGSERAGMVYTADILREMYPDLEVQYFECGEVYTYTDSER